MGGEQAASVLTTVKRDQLARDGQPLSRRGGAGHSRPDPREVRARRIAVLLDGAAVGRRHPRSGRDARGARARPVGRVQRADAGREVRRLPDVGSPHRMAVISTVTPRSRAWRHCASRSNRPEVRNAFDEQAHRRADGGGAAGGARTRRCASSSSPARGRRSAPAPTSQWMSKAVGYYARGEPRATPTDLARMFELLDSLPVPLIGRVHGAALGGGVGLAAVCDVVVAADDAVFGFTRGHARHPAGDDLAVRRRQDRRVGGAGAVPDRRRGSRAQRAKEIGLVHEVVPAAELDAAVDRLPAGAAHVGARARSPRPRS